MPLHSDTTALIAAAHSTQVFDPATVKTQSDALLDTLEAIDVAARAIERLADDVQVAASGGGEDPDVAGTTALYKSKAGVLLRDARTVREPLVRFRAHLLEFQRADRQVRASLKNAGHNVPDEDLSENDLAGAPAVGP